MIYLSDLSLSVVFFVIIAFLLATAGFFLTNVSHDRRAGRGARHRNPGFPRVTPSGTYPRRRV